MRGFIILMLIIGFTPFVKADGRSDEAKAHFDIGMELFKDKEYRKAMEEYRQALIIDPDNPELNCAVAECCYYMGWYEDAIYSYKKVLRERPDYPKAHNSLGVIYYERGMVDEAITQFLEAIKQKEGYWQAHYNLGMAYSKKGKLDLATEELRKALDLSSGNKMVLKKLEELTAGKPLKSQEKAEDHFHLAVNHYLKGDLEDALKELDRARRLDPDNEMARKLFDIVAEEWLGMGEHQSDLR